MATIIIIGCGGSAKYSAQYFLLSLKHSFLPLLSLRAMSLIRHYGGGASSSGITGWDEGLVDVKNIYHGQMRFGVEIIIPKRDIRLHPA